MTVARLPLMYDAGLREMMADIHQIDSHEKVRTEIEYAVMKIGEIGHTLEINKLARAVVYEFYECQLSKEHALYTFNKGNKEEELHIIINLFFQKLQYLSVILFDTSSTLHSNAEKWILSMIKNNAHFLLARTSECLDNRLFPVLCSYLAVDKYVLLLEQTRALCRSEFGGLGYLQTTWLDALEEFKYNCLDDSFWHLVQFCEDGAKVVDIFSKLFVVEKAIGLGIILLQSGKKNKSKFMFPVSIAKHFKFEKREDGVQVFKVFKHEPYMAAEENEILKACKKMLSDLINFIVGYRSVKKSRLLFHCTEPLVLLLLLNARDKDDIKTLYELAAPIFDAKADFKELVNITEWYEWLTSHDKSHNRLQLKLKSFKTELNLGFLEIELTHSEEHAADMDGLKKAELLEARQIATHITIYRKLRHRKVKKNYWKAFNPCKYDLRREAMTFGFDIPEEVDYSRKSVDAAYKLVESVKNMHMVVLNTFFTTAIFDSFDVHYLFTLLEQVDQLYVSSVKIFGESVTGGKGQNDSELSEESIMATIAEVKEELKAWKNNKFMPDEEYIEKKKKIYRIKWQQHKQQQRQQRIAKRAGIKKQDLLIKKAMLLKGKLKGDLRQKNLSVLNRVINI